MNKPWSLAAVCVVALIGAVLAAVPAHAAEQPSARDIQAAVDAYLGDQAAGAKDTLIGGPGSAGYDSGFWIKGGAFSLKVNLTLQARFEGWRWNGSQVLAAQPPRTGDHGSGFALPRATMKFSGTAPCRISYYLELEFGHFGRDVVAPAAPVNNALGPLQQSLNFDSTREAWIQWGMSEQLHVRMGQVRTAATRQLMVAPELQQFVDISLASAFMGSFMPGYTDRNRDFGVALHGTWGNCKQFSYLFTITNGDGADSIRNVIDARTSDGLAFSTRINWAFWNPIGYQEGALRQKTGQRYGELGLWFYYYADRSNLPQTQVADSVRYGLDGALGFGPWSFTGAFSVGSSELAPATPDINTYSFLIQLGYHFPGTAWELAARFSSYDVANTGGIALFVPPGGAVASQHPLGNGRVQEIAFGVNYYINGHGNKVQLDVAITSGDSAGAVQLLDPYAGYQGSSTAAPGGLGVGAFTYGVLVRFQWQLAL